MIIHSQKEINQGTEFLKCVEPRFQSALELTGPLPLRRRSEGFSSLLKMIVSQQVSVASAESIWRRLETAGYTNSKALIECLEEDLRKCGLSKQKASYAKSLAEKNLDYSALRETNDETLVKCLMEIRGIGRWTAEIYGTFSLGRSDIIAAGDLALQESAKILFELSERPSEKELRIMSEPWAPWRAVAARLLWSYYRATKSREGVI